MLQLEEENYSLKENDDFLERKNEESQSNSVKESQEEEDKSIEEEIRELDFQIEYDINFEEAHKGTKILLDLKLKEMELERTLNHQKLKVSSDLYALQEKENIEAKICNCR